MIVMVSVWALHRDPKLWEEDESFELERSKNILTSEFQIFAIDIEYPICIDINIYA
jgi:cytochrome P450